jgi:hypothetical protein
MKLLMMETSILKMISIEEEEFLEIWDGLRTRSL